MGSRLHCNSKKPCNFETIFKRTKVGGNIQLFPCFEAELRRMNVAASDVFLTDSMTVHSAATLTIDVQPQVFLRSRGHCSMNNER